MFFHVLPPSVLLWMPPPAACVTAGPYWSGVGQLVDGPNSQSNSSRFISHVATISVSGSVGSMRKSMTPVRSFTNSTLLQVLPPSVVLDSPRSALGP